MVDSAGIAGLIAHAAFWSLLIVGLVFQELGPRHGLLFGGIWAVGCVGLPYLPYGDMLFTSYIAIVDVVLVFMVFKGDVRLH